MGHGHPTPPERATMVLVHRSHEAGQAFFHQLLGALPPRLTGQPGAGRLIFDCHT